MTILVLLFMLMVAAVVQTTAPAVGALWGAKVPALLGVVVYFALTRERGAMLLSGVLAGIVQDGLGLVPMGHSAMGFCVVGFFVGAFRDVVFSESGITAGVFGAAAAFIFTMGMYCVLRWQALIGVSFPDALLRSVGEAALGALATPVLFSLAGRLDRVVGNRTYRRDQLDRKIRYV